MIICGIDPGTATTGYGIIEKHGSSLQCISYGSIKTELFLSPAKRLNKLFNELNKLFRKYQPKIVGTETIYFFKNAKTAIHVSEARGVILLAAAKKNFLIKEYTPLQIKMNVCGYGRAKKKQVQKMVKEILNLEEIPEPDDAADALAIALCVAYEKDIFKQRGENE
ncbi:crossover junction endodeoxyribonuclease RuvC [Patescibacteria group bacterium]|nr:crossover junction endodeoxyribonuclease RuvC [Patescibacteria group bacterium]